MNNLELSEQDLAAFHRMIGQNVKRIRHEKGVSQLYLANIIGHESVAHIAKAELNKYGKRFNLEHLYKISLALNVSMKDFFEGENELKTDFAHL